MRSVSSRPCVLAQRVHRADQVVARGPRAAARRRAPVSSATVTPSADATAQPVAAAALDEHLVRLELVARGAEAAAVELLELARLRAPACTARSSLPSRGPSTGRFGFTRSSASTRSNTTSFTRTSSAISSACACAPVRALDDEPPQRLAELQPRRRARLVRERRRRARTSAISSSSARRARRRRASRARCTDSGPSGTRFRHRWSVRNGITGASTRSVCTSAYQSVRSAASSPSQKRRRERRMYQFERSSTIRLVGADHVDASGTRSYAARRVARRTRACARRASGRAARSSPVGSSADHDGRKPSMFA